MILVEDPKPSASSSSGRSTANSSSAAPAVEPSSASSASSHPSSSTPLLPGSDPRTYLATAVDDEDDAHRLEAPPPYVEDVKGPSSATRRARARLIRAAVASLVLYALLSAGGLLGWTIARTGGGDLPRGRFPQGGDDDGPPPFGPNSPLHQPAPSSSHRWNETQGTLPSDRSLDPYYCNPVSATAHPTLYPASVFLVPITTQLVGVRFYDSSSLTDDSLRPGTATSPSTPRRDISSQSSVTFLPWTEGVEEGGLAMKVVVEGILSADGRTADHQVCLLQAGGPSRDDERHGPEGRRARPPSNEEEEVVEAWLVGIFISDLAPPPAVKVTVYVPPTPLDAAPRQRPQVFVGQLSGALTIGDLGRAGDGYGPTVFASLLVNTPEGVPSGKIDIESLTADQVIILATPTAKSVRLGNLTISGEASITLEDTYTNIEGRFLAAPGSRVNLYTSSGRIDVSVVVPEQASAAAADSPQTPPASLDAVTIAARTILGNLQLNIPQADARVPLVVSALTNHGIAEVTLPSTYQGRVSVSSSTYRSPQLHFPSGADRAPDPFGLVPVRSFWESLSFTGRFAIIGSVGWAAPGKPRQVDAGWEDAAVDVHVEGSGSGRCELTLLGRSGDPDQGHHDGSS